MKITSKTITWLIMGFLWSIFMGVTAISIGFGALYPPLNYIAKPIACPNGQLSYVQNVSNPVPGTTYTTAGWNCTDPRTGSQTPIDAIRMSVYAGPIYGVLLFVVVVFIWYINARWGSDPVLGKIINRVQGGIGLLVLVLFIGYFAVLPVTNIYIGEFFPTPTPTQSPADAQATMIVATFEASNSGAPSSFNSAATPSASWNDIPIMTEATVGQQTDTYTYTFKVPTDSGTIESFYKTTLKSLGWNLVENQWLGMKLTKDKNTLLVTLAPASDEQSWVVTLVLIP